MASNSTATTTGQHRQQQGLTLVELLTAVVILGLLTGLLVSSYQARSRYQALQSASSAMADWLGEIRKRAMQQNQACSIAISTSDSSLTPASGNACGNFASLTMQSLQLGSERIRFCYRNSDPTTPGSSTPACDATTANSSLALIFSPRGTNRVNGVFEFYLGTDPARTCTVVIQPNGIIRYGTIRSGSCQSES